MSRAPLHAAAALLMAPGRQSTGLARCIAATLSATLLGSSFRASLTSLTVPVTGEFTSLAACSNVFKNGLQCGSRARPRGLGSRELQRINSQPSKASEPSWVHQCPWLLS